MHEKGAPKTKKVTERGNEMKIVALCSPGACCPVVKITDEHVEIGEEGNLCVLTKDQWEALKQKVINKEV